MKGIGPLLGTLAVGYISVPGASSFKFLRQAKCHVPLVCSLVPVAHISASDQPISFWPPMLVGRMRRDGRSSWWGLFATGMWRVQNGQGPGEESAWRLGRALRLSWDVKTPATPRSTSLSLECHPRWRIGVIQELLFLEEAYILMADTIGWRV